MRGEQARGGESHGKKQDLPPSRGDEASLVPLGDAACWPKRLYFPVEKSVGELDFFY